MSKSPQTAAYVWATLCRTSRRTAPQTEVDREGLPCRSTLKIVLKIIIIHWKTLMSSMLVTKVENQGSCFLESV